MGTLPATRKVFEEETLADINKMAERMIDVSERFADAVDGAQGKGPRQSGVRAGARWLLLPAVGAAAYGLVTSSSSIARQTRGLMRRAKDRATDLPDADLFDRVKDATGSSQQRSSSSTSSRARTRRRTSQTQRRRKTTTSGRT
jgi:hypothetical protein